MAEPVSLEQAKLHLRLESGYTDEDSTIEGAIADARAWVENYTGQILVRRSVVEYLDGFSARLLAWPLATIDEVRYRDADDVEQVLDSDSYRVALGGRPARLATIGQRSWPALAAGPGAVRVEMTAGYAEGEVPRGMIRAMLLLISGYYEDRNTGGLADAVETAARAACGPASRGWRV